MAVSYSRRSPRTFGIGGVLVLVTTIRMGAVSSFR